MNKFAKILAWVLIGVGALIILAGIVSLFIHPIIGNTFPATERLAERLADRPQALQALRNVASNRMLGGISFMRSGAMFLFGLLVAAFGTLLHLIANKNTVHAEDAQVVAAESKSSAKK